MKKICIIVIAIIMLSSVVFGASLNLKAEWDANTEPDMKEYRLYRLDEESRRLIAVIPHPQTSHNFTIVVPDKSEGTLRFVLTAVDQKGNESEDSNEATVPFDFIPPARPGGLKVK